MALTVVEVDDSPALPNYFQHKPSFHCLPLINVYRAYYFTEICVYGHFQKVAHFFAKGINFFLKMYEAFAVM